MRPVRPELQAQIIRVAEQQPEYEAVDVALVRHPDFSATRGYNTVVMAFRPTAEERERIGRGEDVYVALLTFGSPQQPIIVFTGKDEASGVFNVAAVRIEAAPNPPRSSRASGNEVATDNENGAL